jgi:hypothetical protein
VSRRTRRSRYRCARALARPLACLLLLAARRRSCFVDCSNHRFLLSCRVQIVGIVLLVTLVVGTLVYKRTCGSSSDPLQDALNEGIMKDGTY